MKELCVDKSRHRAFFTVSVSVLLGGAVLFPHHAQFTVFRESAIYHQGQISFLHITELKHR